ncbi:MAG: hypothetical protein H0X62_14525, partial [Bacteroidetes bacterium]|nr:hypothetical protein [Bacteroidota bacterium]
ITVNSIKGLVFLAVLFAVFSLKAQQQNVPLNRSCLLEIDKHLANPGNQAHTAVKPYLESFIQYDSLKAVENELQGFRTFDSRFKRRLKYESLIVIDTTDFRLEIDPLFNFAFNRDLFDESLKADTTNFYTNTRGVRARGSITEKFSFETTFLENQSFFVNYLDSFVREWQVVPGQGRVKDFKGTGFDYAMASGYVSFSPVKQFNVQFGHGRNFIGEGYRSLLLSDNAFNYPYLKFTTNFLNNKLQYTNIFSSLQTLRRMQTGAPREELFIRKAGSFHYLSINLHPRVQLGLYEGIIWRNSDGNYPQPVNPMFYNPVMGINSAIFAGDTVNHVVNGLNGKIKILDKAFVYGQLLVGRMNFSNLAYQAGFRWFDVFGLKNLHLQAEFNHVKPFVYAFPNELQNYTHYNQPLAHPLMANFNEIVGFLNYRYRDFFVELRGSTAIVQRDVENINSGNNIFLPEQKVIVGAPPGVETSITWLAANFGYIINRKTNMMMKVGFADRVMAFSNYQQNNRIISVSLSTNLFNRYYDF